MQEGSEKACLTQRHEDTKKKIVVVKKLRASVAPCVARSFLE